MHRRAALLLAVALIGGPILCGAVYFMATRPAQAPGAYVEVGNGLYALPGCTEGTASADISSIAAVAPADVLGFFLVLPDGDPARVSAEAARLYLRVVNHAEPQIDYGRAPLAAAVRRMNTRVYRITSAETLRWDWQGPTGALYRQALSRMPGNRATTEVLVELEVPEPSAGFCRYAMTLGPPPSLPDAAVKWFVAPGEKRP